MNPRLFSLMAIGFAYQLTVGATPTSTSFNLRPYTIDLSKGVPRMLDLVRDTRLPEKPQYPGVGSSMGIDLDVLKSLRKQWLEKFNWEKEQRSMNR